MEGCIWRDWFVYQWFLRGKYHECLVKWMYMAAFGGTALYSNGSLGGNTLSVLLSGCISNNALLCFAHGLNDPIIDSFHEQSKVKQSKARCLSIVLEGTII